MTMAARAATFQRIRPLGLEMLDFSLTRIAVVMVVVPDDELPEIVMFNSDPYLRDPSIAPLAYRRVRPFFAIGA